MKSYRVVFSPRAQRDLAKLARYIAEQAGVATATGYVGRIEESADGSTHFRSVALFGRTAPA